MDVDSNSGSPPNAPKYVMLSENGGNSNGVQGPPYRRNIPRYHSTAQPYKKKGNCCLKCICCFYCFLLFVVCGFSATAFYIYALYEPAPPKYEIQHIGIGTFDVQPVDFSLYTEMDVTVKAENLNDRISYFYGNEGTVDVVYSDTTLCTGAIPTFKQLSRNTSFINVPLNGKSEFGPGLQAALTDHTKNGKIPLLIKLKIPVIAILDEFPLKQLTVIVNSSLVIDSLTPKKNVQILSATYNAGLTV